MLAFLMRQFGWFRCPRCRFWLDVRRKVAADLGNRFRQGPEVAHGGASWLHCSPCGYAFQVVWEGRASPRRIWVRRLRIIGETGA